MASFRYRRLLIRRSLPGPAYDAWCDRCGRVHRRRDGTGMNDVDGADSYAMESELVERLKAGELMPSDLVFSGDRWTTFAESPEFFELCEGLFDTRAAAMNLRPIVFGFLGLAIALALVFGPAFLLP